MGTYNNPDWPASHSHAWWTINPISGLKEFLFEVQQKSCGFKSNFSWKSYSSMNLYIAGIVVYGHVGRKKCGLLVIAGFSFDYERFHLDNKKRVVPMGGMKMGTVHGWMSHFTTHISFVSFETHWMRHRHTVRPSLRPSRTMSDVPIFNSNFVLRHKNSSDENVLFLHHFRYPSKNTFIHPK